MSWLKQGFNVVEEEGDRRDSEVQVPELWMPIGQEKRIMFLDQSPACVHTHTVKIHGEWLTFTCLGDTGADDVPCCEILGTKKRQFQGAFTVVDITPYKDKQGNTHVNEIKLFRAKYKTLKLIQEVMADQGGLMGKIIKLKRLEEKSPSSGDLVAFVSNAELPQDLKYRGKNLRDLMSKEEEVVKLAKQLVMPKDKKGLPLVNYMEVLAPKTPKELRTLLRGYKPSTDSGSGAKQADDDVPF